MAAAAVAELSPSVNGEGTADSSQVVGACRQLANPLAHQFEALSAVRLDDGDFLVALAVNTTTGRLWQGRLIFLRLPATCPTVDSVVEEDGELAYPACAPLILETASLLSVDSLQRVSISDCCFLASAATSADSLVLAYSGDDGSVAAARPLAMDRGCEARTEHDSGVAGLCPVGPDSFLSAGTDGVAKLWKLGQDGGLVSLMSWRAASQPGSLLTSVASCTGEGSHLVATCCAGGGVRVWDLRTAGTSPAMEGVASMTASAARCVDWLTPGSRPALLLVSGGVDGCLRLHEPRAGLRTVAESAVLVDNTGVARLRCQGASASVAACFDDGSAPWVLRVADDGESFVEAGHWEDGADVVDTVWLDDGHSLLASCGRRRRLAVWERRRLVRRELRVPEALFAGAP